MTENSVDRVEPLSSALVAGSAAAEDAVIPDPQEATASARILMGVFAAGVVLDVPIANALGTASVVLAAPVVLAGIWQVLRRGAVRRVPPTLAMLTAFVAWVVISGAWARDPIAYPLYARTSAQLLAAVYLGWQVVRTRRELRTLLLGYLLGCSALIAGVWLAYFAGDELGEAGRHTAFGLDPNDLAVTLALGIPMAAYLALTGRTRARYLVLAYVPAALSGVALTGSRGGSLTTGLAVLGVAAFLSRRHAGLFVVVASLVLAGGAFILSRGPDTSLARIFTVEDELTVGTVGDRAKIWRAGVEVFERNPAAGVGAGGFAEATQPALGARVVAHNTPLSVAAQLGAIGFLLFYGAAALAVSGVARAGHEERMLAWTLVLPWILGTQSLTWEYQKTTWLVLLAAAAAGALRRDAPDAAPPARYADDAA